MSGRKLHVLLIATVALWYLASSYLPELVGSCLGTTCEATPARIAISLSAIVIAAYRADRRRAAPAAEGPGDRDQRAPTAARAQSDARSPPGVCCAISASVVSIIDATEAAFCSATRTTLVGSMTPATIRSS
jgi:hypothetical protein